MEDEEITYSDDLLPNSSSAFLSEPDREITRELSEERARVLAAVPLLNELLTWFDDQIEAMDSIDGLDPDQTDLRAQIIGRQLAKASLSLSRGRLESMRDSYAPKSDDR